MSEVIRSIKEEIMMSMPHSVDTPKTRMGLPGTLRRAVELGRQTGIAVTSVVRFGEQESVLKSDGAALGGERVLTTSQAISRCSLCGSPCSPRGIHFCPRLYGR